MLLDHDPDWLTQASSEHVPCFSRSMSGRRCHRAFYSPLLPGNLCEGCVSLHQPGRQALLGSDDAVHQEGLIPCFCHNNSDISTMSMKLEHANSPLPGDWRQEGA